MDVKKLAKQRARRIHDELRDTGAEFTKRQFYEAVRPALDDLAGDAVDAISSWVVEDIDRETTAERPDDQPFLKGFDLDGVIRLGDSRRIDKRFATRNHILLDLQNKDKNMRHIMASNIRAHEEYEKLEPYLTEGVTKEEAVALYQAANPEG